MDWVRRGPRGAAPPPVFGGGTGFSELYVTWQTVIAESISKCDIGDPKRSSSPGNPMSERFEELRAALAARLERVRGNMTDDEFGQLVADITRTAQRFEEIEARERSRKPPRADAPPIEAPDAI